jgi:hypothetical protein
LAHESAHAKPKSPQLQQQTEAAAEARILQLAPTWLADLSAQVARQGEEPGVTPDPQREVDAKAELAQLKKKLIAKKQSAAGASS